MKKSKVIIILLATFFSFVLGSGCYYFFYLSSKKKEVSVPKSNEQKEVSAPKDDVSEVANRDLLLLLQEVIDYEQKVITEKKVRQEDFEKSVEILKDRGIWDGLGVESGVDFEKYYNSTIKDSQEKFKIQLDELLKKVEKEKNLESFRKELEKLGKERKKDIDAFAEFAQKVQTEAEKPMPFFATWVGLVISVIICSLISIFICKCKNKPIDSLQDAIFFMLIHLFLQFLIFPLINCLLSLKMSTFKEMYKHYFCNKSKTLFLFLSIIFIPLFLVFFNQKKDKDKI